MTQHACFLSSEPVQEGRPDQSPSQWPPARLYPWDNPNLQVQERSPGRDMQTGGEALAVGMRPRLPAAAWGHQGEALLS